MANQTTQAGVAIESTPLLAPCPFCGSGARTSSHGRYVSCSKNECPVFDAAAWFTPEQWNTRANAAGQTPAAGSKA